MSTTTAELSLRSTHRVIVSNHLELVDISLFYSYLFYCVVICLYRRLRSAAEGRLAQLDAAYNQLEDSEREKRSAGILKVKKMSRLPLEVGSISALEVGSLTTLEVGSVTALEVGSITPPCLTMRSG